MCVCVFVVVVTRQRPIWQHSVQDGSLHKFRKQFQPRFHSCVAIVAFSDLLERSSPPSFAVVWPVHNEAHRADVSVKGSIGEWRNLMC